MYWLTDRQTDWLKDGLTVISGYSTLKKQCGRSLDITGRLGIINKKGKEVIKKVGHDYEDYSSEFWKFFIFICVILCECVCLVLAVYQYNCATVLVHSTPVQCVCVCVLWQRLSSVCGYGNLMTRNYLESTMRRSLKKMQCSYYWFRSNSWNQKTCFLN